MEFDVQRAMLKGPDLFSRFRAIEKPNALVSKKLPPSERLIVFERAGEKRALLARQMAYHHVAQGELAGEPFLITFWVVCNSGVGLTPIIGGQRHHFSAGGLYNGLVLLIDDETRSYWDHITGACVHGPMSGHRMPVWNVQLTTVAHARNTMPDLLLLQSRQSFFARLISWFLNRPFASSIIPPGFRKTMGPADNRLNEMQMGLGLISGNFQRFYPLARIGAGLEDNWLGNTVHIRLNPMDGIPDACYPDQSRPLQLFTRWYGFSYTFPQSEIYGMDKNGFSA